MQESPTLAPPEAPLPAEGEEPTAPAAPAETPPPEPAAEPAEGAEEEPGRTVEAPTWDGVRESLQGLEDINHDELFDLEAVKPALEKRVQDAHNDAYQELQGHMQTYLQGNSQKLKGIEASLQDVALQMERFQEDGQLDKRGLEDLFRRNQPAFNALNQTYQTTGFWEGVRQYVNLVGQETGDASVAMSFLPRVERMENAIPDPTFMKDLVRKLKAEEAGRDAGYKKGRSDQKKAAGETAAARQRTTEGPSLAPGTPAGRTGNPEEAWAAAGFPDKGPLKEAYESWCKSQGID
jgi:hypothetical protein